jgi:AraC-like DNA-binding protein
VAEGPYAHHVSTLIHVPAVLIENGVDPGRVFREHGVALATMLEPDGWLPRDGCLALANAAVRLTGDRFLGVRHTEKYELEHLGVWGTTILAAPDLRRALNFACASIGLLETGTEVELRVAGAKPRLFFRFSGRLRDDPRQHYEGSLAVLRKILLLAGDADTARLHSARESARDRAVLESLFGFPVSYSPDGDFLEFDRDLLDVPLVARPDPAAGAYLDTVRGLRDLIRDVLPYERPTIESLAPRAAMSVRTAQRRLRERGFTFEALLDDIRRDAAAEQLAGGASVTETAFMLGYSDVAHFTRAFRRWTGATPRDFAKASRTGGQREIAPAIREAAAERYFLTQARQL